MTEQPKRIRVIACDPGGWHWTIGLPSSSVNGFFAEWGHGYTRTRRGGVRAAKRRLRELERKERRRALDLVIDLQISDDNT